VFSSGRPAFVHPTYRKVLEFVMGHLSEESAAKNLTEISLMQVVFAGLNHAGVESSWWGACVQVAAIASRSGRLPACAAVAFENQAMLERFMRLRTEYIVQVLMDAERGGQDFAVAALDGGVVPHLRVSKVVGTLSLMDVAVASCSDPANKEVQAWAFILSRFRATKLQHGQADDATATSSAEAIVQKAMKQFSLATPTASSCSQPAGTTAASAAADNADDGEAEDDATLRQPDTLINFADTYSFLDHNTEQLGDCGIDNLPALTLPTANLDVRFLRSLCTWLQGCEEGWLWRVSTCALSVWSHGFLQLGSALVVPSRRGDDS
jgi:hypothetical protein